MKTMSIRVKKRKQLTKIYQNDECFSGHLYILSVFYRTSQKILAFHEVFSTLTVTSTWQQTTNQPNFDDQ